MKITNSTLCHAFNHTHGPCSGSHLPHLVKNWSVRLQECKISPKKREHQIRITARRWVGEKITKTKQLLVVAYILASVVVAIYLASTLLAAFGSQIVSAPSMHSPQANKTTNPFQWWDVVISVKAHTPLPASVVATNNGKGSGFSKRDGAQPDGRHVEPGVTSLRNERHVENPQHNWMMQLKLPSDGAYYTKNN